ncbi:MAG: nicotinate-nucleotide--dimethylbenzimidazole phosphoribosyltransferase [Bryobacteraceae bacterium]
MTIEQQVQTRLNSLTKPPGSLGRLEEIALRYCLIRNQPMPKLKSKAMYVFCADHGVVAEGVSSYPQEVTRQMVSNFISGGAAINVLCRHYNITQVIVDVGVCGEVVPGAVAHKLGQGTRNMAKEPAMTSRQANDGLAFGRQLATAAAAAYDVVGLGEMGIGNTTSAAAILAAYAGCDVADAVGPGAGLDRKALAHKTEVVRRTLELHRPHRSNGIELLEAVGGFEIAAIAGFLLGAYEVRLPVVLDGFPCSAAALIARAMQPNVLETAFFSHLSQEPGHRVLFDLLQVRPYCDFDMRLGEGTGAAIMIGLIDASLHLYREMATFEEAQVSTESEPG